MFFSRNKRFTWLIKIAFATAAFLMLAVAPVAYGAESIPVLEQKMENDTIVLYLKKTGEYKTASVQIGNLQAEDAVIDGYDGDIPTRTWLLIDNSQSIYGADRTKTLQVFSDLVAGRMNNERFTLCTFDEHLQILLEDSQSYPDLKTAIEKVEYKTQETYLTDALNELLDREKAKEDTEFVRVVIACDGGETNTEGLTREELSRRLQSQNIPIYVLGCKVSDNEQSLNDMYALSRMTGAQSWTLSDMDDTLPIVTTMSTAEAPIRATFPIPEEAKDGADKGIQLSFADGSTAVAQMSMPFGKIQEKEETPTVQEPAPQPSPEPEPKPEPEPEIAKKRSPIPLILIAAALLAAAASAAVVMMLRKKKAREQIVQVSDYENPDSNDTVRIQNQTEFSDSDTVKLVNTESRFILRLTDTEDPARYFEAPISGHVSIGRNQANQIVIDYDKSVSNKHCEVFIEGCTFKVRDLNSSNGTYIDGIRITDGMELANGSRIRMGRLEFIVDIL